MIRIFDLENEGQGRWGFGWKLASECTLTTCICVIRMDARTNERTITNILPCRNTPFLSHRNSVKKSPDSIICNRPTKMLFRRLNVWVADIYSLDDYSTDIYSRTFIPDFYYLQICKTLPPDQLTPGVIVRMGMTIFFLPKWMQYRKYRQWSTDFDTILYKLNFNQ